MVGSFYSFDNKQKNKNLLINYIDVIVIYIFLSKTHIYQLQKRFFKKGKNILLILLNHNRVPLLKFWKTVSSLFWPKNLKLERHWIGFCCFEIPIFNYNLHSRYRLRFQGIVQRGSLNWEIFWNERSFEKTSFWFWYQNLKTFLEHFRSSWIGLGGPNRSCLSLSPFKTA